MPLLPTLGRTVGTGVKAVRLLVRGSLRGSAWATRRVGSARARGAANEVGMIRLFDLHAISCAGDALIAIGLAGTIFSVPLGEARSKVALYLLITMVPFALLAPVVGPLLDHFRHGRRYALASTMLGRAFLAYVMSDNLLGWGLYPAAFGVLAFSRAYGVARSAAVPRLLPEGVGLSQVGARASVYGTFAGALVAPIGLLAFKFGPQWSLRVATVIFMLGVVVALRLPPRADSDPPEAMPRPWRAVLRIGRGTDRPLSGKLVVATLIGSSSLRLLYGFLLLFLTFAIMGGNLDTTVFGMELSRGAAVGVVGAALALGTFLSTAAGTGLTIRRPLALQSSGLVVAAGVAVLTTIFYNLVTVTLLALLTATFSGLAKLAVDASIQERVPEQQRATAFAHSETFLMLAWVAGGGMGLIPLTGQLGIGLAALLAVLAAARAAWAAARLHNERLAGRPDATINTDDPDSGVRAPDSPPTPQPERRPTPPSELPADPWPDAPTVFGQPPTSPAPGTSAPGTSAPGTPGSRAGTPASAAGTPGQRRTSAGGKPRVNAEEEARRRRQGALRHKDEPGTPARPRSGDQGATDPTLIEPPAERKWWQGRRKEKPSTAPGPPTEPPTERLTSQHQPRTAGQPEPPTAGQEQPPVAPPGFHVYRPSSAGSSTRNGDAADDEDS
ncbi:MFS transporter [Actinoplanes sp. GCM10030250]|uniref:MFS transporter n=1 Tax=Actinoplanes sp. GCM10030250 TaxID=3273376 RepID=UPI00361A8EE7